MNIMLPAVVIYLTAFFGCMDIVTCMTIEAKLNHEKESMDNFEENLEKYEEYLTNAEDINNEVGDELDNNIELRAIGGTQNHSMGVYEDMQVIFPGTKWCGTGNIAANEDDLGYFEAADRCCREHDHCANFISAGGKKYGLNNDAFYTRVECSCDLQFYHCLKAADTMTANEIGFSYFDLIETKCFKEDYPIIQCHQYSSALKHRCKVYQLDKSKPKVWQWFEVPIY